MKDAQYRTTELNTSVDRMEDASELTRKSLASDEQFFMEDAMEHDTSDRIEDVEHHTAEFASDDRMKEASEFTGNSLASDEQFPIEVAMELDTSDDKIEHHAAESVTSADRTKDAVEFVTSDDRTKIHSTVQRSLILLTAE